MLVDVERIQKSLVKEYESAPGMFSELARLEELLAETYRDRIQYELLQNSDDAGSSYVEVTLKDDGTMHWVNDGRSFDLRDVESLCRSASSTKTRGDSIGYRGIGFKSLAATAQKITVESGGASFSFHKEEAVSVLSGAGSVVKVAEVPLIRIPVEIQSSAIVQGSRFSVKPKELNNKPFINIELLSLLFLRNVKTLQVVDGNEIARTTKSVVGEKITICAKNDCSEFALLSSSHVSVAIPLNESALAKVGSRGKLYAFLPLNDYLGIPLIVSGDFLTDPSRTNVVVTDSATVDILNVAAKLIAEHLSDPQAKYFQKLWELLAQGEDLRALLSFGQGSAAGIFVMALRSEMQSRQIPFSVLPISLEPDEVALVFPQGAPKALYTAENQNQTKALQIALGLPKSDVGVVIGDKASSLHEMTIRKAVQYIDDLASAKGVQLSASEQKLVDFARKQFDISNENGDRSTRVSNIQQIMWQPTVSFPDVVKRWRTAELSACEWLNMNGWNVEDVSLQNLGYDLVGTNPAGEKVMIEIKRITRMNEPFAMTNNEMGAAQVESGKYWLGLIIGSDSQPQFGLLDPRDEKVHPERVCKAWEWRFNNWAPRITRIA
ncbi:DUF3883 domain-containing protein [Corynebacterium ulcerans]|nr:DUF3883 domain-containing protein [Corynebacterium ulcerans]QQU24951.1 DUF3883 domain-containing protein [Corynebacterium ulcerans]